MTLKELGKQYLEEAAVIKKLIGETREKIPHTRGRETIYLTEKLGVMFQEYVELRKNGLHLLHYYKRGRKL